MGKCSSCKMEAKPLTVSDFWEGGICHSCMRNVCISALQTLQNIQKHFNIK